MSQDPLFNCELGPLDWENYASWHPENVTLSNRTRLPTGSVRSRRRGALLAAANRPAAVAVSVTGAWTHTGCTTDRATDAATATAAPLRRHHTAKNVYARRTPAYLHQGWCVNEVLATAM
jgi:hypothetical protein